MIGIPIGAQNELNSQSLYVNQQKFDDIIIQSKPQYLKQQRKPQISSKQYIAQNTRPINDYKYVALDSIDNYRVNDYRLQNYRTERTTKNPNYISMHGNHKQYDMQGIMEGQGGGMNPDLDSYLTRGNWVNVSNDNLVEQVGFVRYIDFLPPTIIPTEFCHEQFLVSTSISDDPQKNFEPEFDQYGIQCRNYQRYSDEYWRKMANATNKYRFPSKYYRIVTYGSGKQNVQKKTMNQNDTQTSPDSQNLLFSEGKFIRSVNNY